MTCSKTILYFLYDIVDPSASSHPKLSPIDYWGIYILPTSLWIIIPFIIISNISKQILNGLSNNTSVKSNKQQ